MLSATPAGSSTAVDPDAAGFSLAAKAPPARDIAVVKFSAVAEHPQASSHVTAEAPPAGDGHSLHYPPILYASHPMSRSMQCQP